MEEAPAKQERPLPPGWMPGKRRGRGKERTERKPEHVPIDRVSSRKGSGGLPVLKGFYPRFFSFSRTPLVLPGPQRFDPGFRAVKRLEISRGKLDPAARGWATPALAPAGKNRTAIFRGHICAASFLQ